MAMVRVDPGRDLSLRNRLFLRRVQQNERPGPRRPLTAAAAPIDLTSRSEARKLRVLRQGWQTDAAAYVRCVPELSFAYRFLAHASGRMRYFPALVNPEEPDGPPIPAREHPDAPSGLVDSMEQALASLGVGRLAMTPLQESLSYNFGVPGECFLVGQTDPAGGDDWKIRSIEEFMVFDDQYKVREVPLDPQGVLGWTDLDPENTYAARMWIPDFMFSKMASSPMRALLDTAEELLLLSRDVRAIARSRLAGGGIMKMPEGLRMQSLLDDNEDPESEDFFGKFAEVVMAPLTDEGTASAVVPVFISGDPESLAQLDHLVIDRPYSAMAIELRAEAIGRLATGLDFPREILEGIGDVNHWSGALVSDETFRHHIEPQVIKQVDAMTVAYLRWWLTAAGFETYWVDRACIWYNPVDLIAKPDPMGNALPLFDRFAINYQALREAGGFTEDDAPSVLEFYARQLAHIRTFPPNVLEAIIHEVDPNLVIPPIGQSGTIPGMGPDGPVQPQIEGAPIGAPPAATAAPPAPAPSPAVPAETPPTAPSPAPAPAAAATPAPSPTNAPSASSARMQMAEHRRKVSALTSRRMQLAEQQAGDRLRRQRLSRRLSEIDAQLRSRVQTATASAMLRILDRAGAKLRTKVNDRRFRDPDTKALVASIDNRFLAGHLGGTVVAALGFPDAHALLNPDWSDVKAQFRSWTAAAQADAVRVAAQLAGVPADDPSIAETKAVLAAGIEPAWQFLERKLGEIAQRLLYDPDPNSDGTVNVNPNTVVPMGVVRQALTIAGAGRRGLTASSATDGQQSVIDPTATVNVGDGPVPPGDNPAAAMTSIEAPPYGQIGNGGAVSDFLGDNSMVPVGYTWEHLGSGDNPFEPHLDLDGVAFSSFDDDVLANDYGFPEVDFFLPGDHEGCFPAGTVVSGPSAAGSTLRYWKGELVDIATASGEFLSATPNHPILTTRGWIGAGALNEGDEVIRCPDGEAITRLIPNDYQMPARIEEVAYTVGVDSSFGPVAVPVAAEDFYGDGAGSKVAVVRADSDLRDRLDAALCQPSCEPPLGIRDPYLRVGMPGESTAGESVIGVPEPALSGVSGLGLGEPGLGVKGRGEKDARLLDRSRLNTEAGEALSDVLPAGSGRPGERGNRLAGLVATDEVIHIERRPFAGHVYNLDTGLGWYLAGTTQIVVGNCGCDYTTEWGPASEAEPGAVDENGMPFDGGEEDVSDSFTAPLGDALSDVWSLGQIADDSGSVVNGDHFDAVTSGLWQAIHAQEDTLVSYPDQWTAIQDYTGAMYRVWNDALRTSDFSEDATVAGIADMVSAFRLAGSKLSQDVRLFRGIRHDAQDLIDSWEEGQVLVDPGFMSTSLDRGWAEGFQRASGGALVEIAAPAGQDYLVGTAGEMELILPPNVTLKIDSITVGPEDRRGAKIIKAHVVVKR